MPENSQDYKAQHDQLLAESAKTIKAKYNTPNPPEKDQKELPITALVDANYEDGQDLTISNDPVKDVLVFPHQNNRTYRSGYVQLIAFANDFSLKNIAGKIDDTLDYKQTHTKAREKFKVFNGTPSAYLANARANNRRQRKIPGTKMVFSAILPMPLGIGETTAIEYQSAASGYNKAIVGAAHEAGSNIATYIKSGGTFDDDVQRVVDTIKNGVVDSLGSSASFIDDKLGNIPSKLIPMKVDASVLGHNVINGALLGDNSMHNAALNSVAGGLVTRPTKKMMSLSGSLMDYAREAAALNGRRQLIMDPGYWQSFQGVQPRSFTLKWSIIPENHEDAMNGLALCARLKEFSLPETVSEVELLSPHYWQVQFSNPLVQSQLLYGNLVITNLDFTFMDDGEVHLSGTPKKFDITITFSEAKAPNADVFKVYDEKLELAGGKLRNSPSTALESVGGIINGSGPGGGSLSDIFAGGFDGLGSGVLGKLGELKDSALGAVAGIAGDALGGLSTAISGNVGGAVGSIFGDYAGNIVADTVSNAVNSAGSVLVNAIATGDFDDLGDKMKDAALAGATSTVIDAASEVVGEYVSKVTDYAMDTLGTAVSEVTDWVQGMVGDLLPEETTAKVLGEEAKAAMDKVQGLKDKLKDVEASTTLTPEQKAQARAKVEEEYAKAKEKAREAADAKKAAEDARKLKEQQDAEKTKEKQQQSTNNKADAALADILGG